MALVLGLFKPTPVGLWQLMSREFVAMQVGLPWPPPSMARSSPWLWRLTNHGYGVFFFCLIFLFEGYNCILHLFLLFI
jgi:hypothetical protein